MFKYGNPIILEGSGRIKTDALNESRIEQVLGRFEQWAGAQGQLEKFSYSVTKDQVSKSLIAFPAAGFAVPLFPFSSAHLLPSLSCTPTPSTSASSSPSSPRGWATGCTCSTSWLTTTHAGLATSGTTPQTSRG